MPAPTSSYSNPTGCVVNFLYNLGIHLYKSAVRIASLSNPKAKKMVEGHKETFGRLQAALPAEGGAIWIHASSLGEFEQGRPLIERLRREYPDRKILLTFFSPSGYEVRKNYPLVDAVTYLPFDTPRNARRLIRAINPEMVFFVKYEIWRNLLHALYRRRIPTYLISAAFTPKQRFFRRSTRWYALWLKWFTRIFVQDERSRNLLAGIGIDNAVVAGDTRFDRVTDIMRTTREIPALQVMRDAADTPLLMVGSSWEADENLYFPWLRDNKGKIRAVIAPHEFDDRRIETMRSRLSPLKVVLMSEAEAAPEKAADADVLIINCFGLLSSAYRYADMAYVGGGFGTGIHNINEAAVYGIPVVFGPNHSRFLEAQGLIDAGGGFSVADAAQIAATLTELSGDPERRHTAGEHAAAYIKGNLGATERILATLNL